MSDLSKTGGPDLHYRSCMSDNYSAQEKDWWALHSAESALTQSSIPPQFKRTFSTPSYGLQKYAIDMATVHAYCSMLVLTWKLLLLWYRALLLHLSCRRSGVPFSCCKRRDLPTGLEEAYGVCKLFPLSSVTDAHVALRLIRDSTDLALCLRALDCLIVSWWQPMIAWGWRGRFSILYYRYCSLPALSPKLDISTGV